MLSAGLVSRPQILYVFYAERLPSQYACRVPHIVCELFPFPSLRVKLLVYITSEWREYWRFRVHILQCSVLVSFYEELRHVA